MVATYQILSLLLIFALSLLIVRIGSVALRMTGLSPDVASFQAASAFSGAGFTTEEAEQTVTTPARRSTVKTLIRLGSIGLVSGLTSLLLSFTNANEENLRTLLYILGGVVLLILFAWSQWINSLMTPIIEWALSRTTDFNIRDYTRVLGLQNEYRIAEVDVDEDEWLANDTAEELNLADEGVILLGIERGEDYIGAPGPDTEIRPGDTVVLYGKEDRLQEISNRNKGNIDAHEDAIEEHEDILDEQEQVID
ncbi:potassium channel family protein [Natrinema soli]|uniref:Potassium channel family protein n=1 Tax=Natrinema soli TaxID=1930624 RepID=A0ABD5SFK8_9EURY|nr:TrkA C-terminal domain-containing protein [Natrinema soli]